MIVLSLLLNIAVLVPVCLGLLQGAIWTDQAYGPASPARGILLAIYVAMLLLSLGLLIRPVPAAVAALLAVQVIYKLATAQTVGMANPVVIANLGIAAFHVVTLVVLWRTAASPA